MNGAYGTLVEVTDRPPYATGGAAIDCGSRNLVALVAQVNHAGAQNPDGYEGDPEELRKVGPLLIGAPAQVPSDIRQLAESTRAWQHAQAADADEATARASYLDAGGRLMFEIRVARVCSGRL